MKCMACHQIITDVSIKNTTGAWIMTTQKDRMRELMMEVLQTGKPVVINNIHNKCGEEISRNRMSSIITELCKDKKFEGVQFYTRKHDDGLVYLHSRQHDSNDFAAVLFVHKLMTQCVEKREPVTIKMDDVSEPRIRAYVSYIAKQFFNNLESFSVNKQPNGSLLLSCNKNERASKATIDIIGRAINSPDKMEKITINIDTFRWNLSMLKSLPEYVHYDITTKKIVTDYYVLVDGGGV